MAGLLSRSGRPRNLAESLCPCDLLCSRAMWAKREKATCRGMRHLYERSPWRESAFRANVVLDGAGCEVAVDRGVGEPALHG